MLRRVSIGHYSLGYTTSISDGHIPVYDLEVLPRSGWTTLQDNSYRMGLFDGEFIHIYDTGQLVPDDVTWRPIVPEKPMAAEGLPAAVTNGADDRKKAVELAALSLTADGFKETFGIGSSEWLLLSEPDKIEYLKIITEVLDASDVTLEELSYVAKSISERHEMKAITDESGN